MKNFKQVVMLILWIGAVGASPAQEAISTELIVEEPLPPVLNLPLMDSVPETGNFFSAAHDWPPLPFNYLSTNSGVKVYSIAEAFGKTFGAPFYLIDDRAYVQAQEQSEKEELALQMLEAAARGEKLDRFTERTPEEPHVAYRGMVPTGTDLLLDLEDATNGVSSLTIYNPDWATNSPVWDVYGIAHLNDTNWTWLLRTEPGQTNVFAPMLSDAESYYRLGDTNDLDGDSLSDLFEQWVSHSDPQTNSSNGNGLLDGWMWTHFGHVMGSASDNTLAGDDYDADGVSNLDEQTAGTDPNTIQFTLSMGNQHFNTTSATGSFLVFNGVPSYWTVLVNNTNHDAAVWQPYDGSISFPIGPTNGEYEVEFGLKGRATNSEITWNGTVVTLDSTSPVLVITYPTNSTVAQPILQLRGYSTEPLATVEYGVTNTGTAPLNELGFVIGSEFDTNTLQFTTNFFQCYDIELTNGVNCLAVRVTDEAGNTTTTNFSITFDSAIATNIPAGLHLVWPTNGMSLSGSSFTLDGKLDDTGATVFATIISTNGSTNTIEGVVERDGKFWVDGLPLAAGTNQLTLNVTNSAGVGGVTNLTVIKSSVVLTLGAITGNLWGPHVQVAGTVSDPSQAVWVNGVKATVAGDGSWVADKVPTTPGGSAEFEIIAYEPGEPQP